MGTTLQSEVKSCPIRALDIPGRDPLPSLWHLLLFSCRGNWPTKTYLHITHSRVQAMTNGFHFLIIDWWYLDTPDCPNWLRDKILFIFIFLFRSGGGEWGCHQLYIQVYLTKYAKTVKFVYFVSFSVNGLLSKMAKRGDMGDLGTEMR